MFIISDSCDKESAVLFQRSSTFGKLRDWGMTEKEANNIPDKAIEFCGETIIDSCFEVIYKPVGGESYD